MKWLVVFVIALIVFVIGLLMWRQLDVRNEQAARETLLDLASKPIGVFDLQMIDELPDVAQRYFRYTIQPGTPLFKIAELEMRGELGLGRKENPKYNPMTAHQILAPPHGLVWQLKSRGFVGTDVATPRTSWTRFWLYGLIPVVRAGGNSDHHLSAFGRVVSEGAFWVPASLLPSEAVRWEPVSDHTARAIVTYEDFEQAIDITVAANGQPIRVTIQRWSNENAEAEFRFQPFGGDLSEFKTFGGFTIPTRVEGGNHIGTTDYFPFYRVEIIAIQFGSNSDSN